VVQEGVVYTVVPEADAQRVCVRYVGAFPVYGRERSLSDYKGVIAFDTLTLRASEQTKWYPVLYDPASGVTEEAVSYRLRVRCQACQHIYLNGSPPGDGPEVVAESEVPRPLLLYAGRFPVSDKDGILYVGAAVSDSAASEIGRVVRETSALYEGFVGLPYAANPVLLSFWPVTRRGERSGWAFTSWPTIAFAERTSFDSLLEDGHLAAGYRYLLSHEMAHYYFGTVLAPAGPYRWFFLESTADYMALKALQRLQGDDAMRSRLDGYRKAVLEDSSLVRLDRIDSEEEISYVYRYRYGPLLWLALEKQVGESSVRRLLHLLLTGAAGGPLDYEALRRTAIEAGVAPDEWARFERDCIVPAPQASCLMRKSESMLPTRADAGGRWRWADGTDSAAR
jgi:hypothetical protein